MKDATCIIDKIDKNGAKNICEALSAVALCSSDIDWKEKQWIRTNASRWEFMLESDDKEKIYTAMIEMSNSVGEIIRLLDKGKFFKYII